MQIAHYSGDPHAPRPCCFSPSPACSPTYQTTSGSDYLAARAGQVPTDPEIAALAAVEGHLTFPARIGVARIVHGNLETLPAEEAALLADLAARTSGFGTFDPISPMVATLAVGNSYNLPQIERARRGAARQHMDYLLAFQIDTRLNTAEAVFVDVRTGYPYATAMASVPGRGLGAWANGGRINARALDLTRALLPEVEAMLMGLAARAE